MYQYLFIKHILTYENQFIYFGYIILCFHWSH